MGRSTEKIDNLLIMGWSGRVKTSAPIAEGFAGETIIVIPPPMVERARQHALLKGLLVTAAGYFPKAANHAIERPLGAPEALLIICQEGRGWVRIGDGTTRWMEPGEAVWIAPQTPHAYGASMAEPWTIQWAHFIGEELADWQEILGLAGGSGFLKLRPGVHFHLHFARVHETLQRHLGGLLSAASAIRWTLANLSLNEQLPDPARPSLDHIEAWLREHVSRPSIPLAEMAQRARLSPSHFSACFRKRFGHSPIDYFLRLKMERACRLLEQNDWPVRAIGEEVGIHDPYYFSRRFRAALGCSPRDYRKRAKDNP